MNKREAIKAMIEGYKIRDRNWGNGAYLYMNEYALIKDENGDNYDDFNDLCNHDSYEIVPNYDATMNHAVMNLEIKIMPLIEDLKMKFSLLEYRIKELPLNELANISSRLQILQNQIDGMPVVPNKILEARISALENREGPIND